MSHDQEITIIEKNVPHYMSLTVVNQATLQEASEYLIQAKKEYKYLKKDMDTLLAPSKEQITLIKEKYDPRLKALEAVVERLSQQTTIYQTQIVNAKAAAEEKIAAKVTSGYIKTETALNKLEGLGTIQKNVETDTGSMSFVAHALCELEDITKVPLKYHTVDMVAIRAEMKAGNKYPGIRYWTEQRPRNTR